MVALPSHTQPFRHFDQQPVTDGWRHTRGNPCPVCHDGDYNRDRNPDRCYGRTDIKPDGRQWTICTRADYAGTLSRGANGYTHLSAGGVCKCGEDHSAGAARPAPRRSPAPRKPNTGRIHKKYPPIATHEYRDADGALLFRVARLYRGHAKPAHYPEDLAKCYPQRPDGRGDWYDGLEGAPYAGLYRLPELIAADPWEPVFVVGGELCADAIADAGGVATCNAGGEGAGKWRDWYNAFLQGRNVVILPDDDATGKEHAQAVADALASVAASVRVVTLEGAHDVGDWIDAGGTLGELRKIAADAPIIAARQPSSQTDSFTLQDGLSKLTPQTEAQSCPRCRQWQDRARIAETTVRNLRAEQAIEDKYLAIPNETMSAPEKVAAIALRRELATKKCDDRVERDAERRPRIYRNAIAQRTGWKESQASANVQKVVALGFFERSERRSRDDTATFYAPGPHFDQPEAVATPERANTWGGVRVKLCACGSANLETRITRRIVCRDCGTVVEEVTTQHDTNNTPDDPTDERDTPQSQTDSFTLQDGLSNETPTSDQQSDPTDERDTQEERQDNPPPVSILVSNLAPVDAGGASWIGGRVLGCEHPERMRRRIRGVLTCGCGAHLVDVPALDSAEVRAYTERSIGG